MSLMGACFFLLCSSGHHWRNAMPGRIAGTKGSRHKWIEIQVSWDYHTSNPAAVSIGHCNEEEPYL